MESEKGRLSALKMAFGRYREALLIRSDELHRDGTIQRFEYTLENAWKALKAELLRRGVDANSPREVFRLSAREGLIGDVGMWFDFVEKRNLASHVYREEDAKAIEAIFETFERAVLELIATLEAPQERAP